ncbi:hypothetical protein BN946_scf184815.g50 [Trametes cinnabarina]|uniref:Uncharacterized protein n=1 Tax=Pycnoporus cinnabarinus TaxID=5643 RepID=A0A060S7P3_PYCCI|nr:hypothetical protein BN946_scf184815.g50 [Trametes cinnabarina]
MPWRVDFSPTTLLPEEQPNITTQVTTAHNNVQALRQARNATVYSAGGRAWWHTSRNDTRMHVTVRFLGANRPTRAHVYEDGTASIRPARRAALEIVEEDDGTYSPFSDEEVEADGEVAET